VKALLMYDDNERYQGYSWLKPGSLLTVDCILETSNDGWSYTPKHGQHQVVFLSWKPYMHYPDWSERLNSKLVFKCLFEDKIWYSTSGMIISILRIPE
jgi:hypothetical protein